MRPGQRVGKYVLGEQIAHGGMAEVWAARAEGPGGFVKPLALKFIRESFAGNSELERLFLNEARLAARLQHANLVGVFDFDRVGETDDPGAPGRYYIAMERVDGQDLRRVVQAARQKGHRISPSVALYIMAEVLKGLRYVHERRDERGQALELVHRDVSPHNVLVGRDGEVKLSDFGIAKARMATGNIHTQAGTVRGKLAYASPEQLRGEPLDHRTDQFALGVVLWELLADRRLFDGASEKAIVDKVMAGHVPSLPEGHAVAPEVEAIARRMLAPRAADRFASTAEALNATLTAPGYSPDARPLAELMGVLFAAAPRAVPRTVPMNLADALEDAVPRAPAPSPRAQAPTVEVLPTAHGEDSGSSYVSDGWSLVRPAERRQRSPVRLAFAATALVMCAIAAGITWRRLAARRGQARAHTPVAVTVAGPAPSAAGPPAPEPRPPDPVEPPPDPSAGAVPEVEPPSAAPPELEPRPAAGPPPPARAVVAPPLAPQAPAAIQPPSSPEPPVTAADPAPAAAVARPSPGVAPRSLTPPPVAPAPASLSATSEAPAMGLRPAALDNARKAVPPNAAPILE